VIIPQFTHLNEDRNQMTRFLAARLLISKLDLLVTRQRNGYFIDIPAQASACQSALFRHAKPE
jgi:hypothetical protein